MRANIPVSPSSNNTQAGFTIVELLIVIVVIGILAAITIVAYNGVQNKAYDTTVQADLRNLSTRIEMFNVDNGKYAGGTTDLSTLGVKLKKDTYAMSPASQINFIYCSDSTSAATTYAIVAMSKSGKKFIIGDGRSLSEYAGAWGTGSSTTCSGISASLDDSFSGYSSTDTITGPWRAWTGAN
jgi:prepilin-type N-terminal cleavage/methylation domain-containing protein